MSRGAVFIGRVGRADVYRFRSEADMRRVFPGHWGSAQWRFRRGLYALVTGIILKLDAESCAALAEGCDGRVQRVLLAAGQVQ